MKESTIDRQESQAKRLLEIEDWQGAINTYAKIERNRKTRLDSSIYFNDSVKAALGNNTRKAIELTCRTLAIEPLHVNASRNLAILLKSIKALRGAKVFAENYTRNFPDCEHGYNTYGTILTELGDHNGAISAFTKALSINPNYAHANLNLSNEYHIQANIDLAYIYMSKAIHTIANEKGAWLDALTHFRRVCDFEALDSIDWWGLINQLQERDISSTFLQVLTLAETEEENKQLLTATIQCSRVLEKNANIEASKSNIPIAKNGNNIKTKVGFISGDFRDHSIARFIWPLFEHLDRNEFEINCYSTYQANDQWTARFKASASKFAESWNLSPKKLCETIRKDRIDVLFDLTGFTMGSRSSTFIYRCAPNQVSWLGFPGTTGLSQMDYLMVDKHLAPKYTDLVSEKLLITPGTSVCFSSMDEVPITPKIPELQRGYLTIGTLNNSYKITRATVKRWSSVLRQIPTAQFLFVRREFQSHYLRSNICKEFEANQINTNRIHFFNNRLANRHYLDCYNEIDLTLDTFPVTGGTTTTDALWMGVPVISLEGPNIHQRVCSAILHHAGHPEWIAHSDSEYLKIALSVARDQDRRIELRHCLREELKRSLLCNSKQFAKDFKFTINNLLINQ